MKFRRTGFEGLFVVELERLADSRGFFARSWCAREFADHGLEIAVAQCNISYNEKRGTLRGLHFQQPPHEETKIVRCTRGAIFDVIVDLRPQSPSYLRWQGFELTAENRKALYVPKGFAHGFQTLADNAEIVYQISEFYAPNSAGGYRFDDAAIGIAWPVPVTLISERDLSWPAFNKSAAASVNIS